MRKKGGHESTKTCENKGWRGGEGGKNKKQKLGSKEFDSQFDPKVCLCMRTKWDMACTVPFSELNMLLSFLKCISINVSLS